MKSDAQQRLRSRGVSEQKGFLSDEMGTGPPRGNAAALGTITLHTTIVGGGLKETERPGGESM